MAKYRVVIPDEVFAALEWEDEGLPAICAVNKSLANFEPKIVFSWHLSIIIDLAELTGNGMPTPEEHDLVSQIAKRADAQLKRDGNALFLARITWNATRQFLYRIHDPEIANAFLREAVDDEQFARPLEFRMERDKDWTLAKWYLQHWET